jgi:hypothetical protein
LSFDPGDAFQFDWSHEWVQMATMLSRFDLVVLDEPGYLPFS